MIGISALGIGIRSAQYLGQGWPIVVAYKSRVTADGGYYEGVSCLLNKLNNRLKIKMLN
jgi:hypothetical protein